MDRIKIFIDLTRLNKPIGFMLLFWPCAWGLAFANSFDPSLDLFLYYLILFFLGSVFMRSAGCIFNDIVDKDFDKKVTRTKQRPIAAEKIKVLHAFIYVIALCGMAFLILIQFNFLTIVLGLSSMFLAFAYPFMKRITYWPQLFLGITFNYGLILGWTAIEGQINLAPIIFYLGAIFWTLGYDTIYGYQDIKDDEIIGLKSTSIKFKKNAKKFLITCYTIFIICFLIGAIKMELNSVYYLILIIPIIQLFFFQIKIFNQNVPASCLKAFKSNNLFGLLIFINILIVKIL